MHISNNFSRSGLLLGPGQAMTQEEFYKFLFRDYINDVKSFGFLGNEFNDFARTVSFDKLEKTQQLEVYMSHFSVGLYYKPTGRLKENLRYILCIPFDIDWGKKGVYLTKSEVYHSIKQATGLELSAIWNSKSPFCYHGVLRIEMMIGTAKSINLVEWVAKRIAEITNCDEGGTNSNQWLRIKKVEKFSDKIYNIDDLKKFLPSKEELKKKKEQYGKVTSFSDAWLLRQPAIVKLLNGDLQGWRNNASFTAAILLRMIGKSEEETLQFLGGKWFLNVNKGFPEPFLFSEVRSTVKSAYSGRYLTPSKSWISSVTGEPFPYNLGYIRTKYKKAEEVRVAIIDYLRERDGVVSIKQKELAEAIKMPYSSVKDQLKWLKDNGIIDKNVIRGGNDKEKQGTFFKLLENSFSQQNEIVVEVDYGYEEIDENMC